MTFRRLVGINPAPELRPVSPDQGGYTMLIDLEHSAFAIRRQRRMNTRWLAPTLVTMLTIAMTIAFTLLLADSL
jgi:hypothetical protein